MSNLPQLRRSLVGSSISSVVVRFVGLGLLLLNSIVLARAMGLEGYGIFALVLSFLALAGIPAQMGIPTLVLRETSRGAATEDWSRVKSVWAWAARRIFVSAPVAVLTGLLPVAVFAPAGTFWAYVIGAPMVLLVALGFVRDAALRGLQHPVGAQVSDTVIRPLLVLLLIGGYWFIGAGQVGAELAMTLTVVAAAAVFGIGSWMLTKLRPRSMASAVTGSPDPSWADSVWPLAGLAAAQVIGQQVGLVTLGLLATPADVAHFKIAQSANSLATVGLVIVSFVLAPRIAHMHVRGELADLQRLVAQAAAVSVATLLPTLLLLYLVGERLIALLYGEVFLPAFPMLLVLLAGQCANAFFGSVISLLNMTGHERKTLVGISVGTLTNIVLAAILIPLQGAIGAAIAASVAMLIWNILLWRSALKATSIDSTVFGFFRSVSDKTGDRPLN